MAVDRNIAFLVYSRVSRLHQGQIDMAPDVDFVYDDTDQLKAETAGFFLFFCSIEQSTVNQHHKID